MKLRYYVLFTVILFVSAAAAYSQPAPTKLAFIDTGAFGDEKAGITKYVNAYKSLIAEFKLSSDELKNIDSRIAAIAKEVQGIQDKLNGPPAGLDVAALKATFDSKIDEGQRLQLDLKRKQEDFKAKYEKREAAVIGPLNREIGVAIDVYRKAKGYDLILDATKIGESILGYDKSLDITDAFILDFNAKASGVPVK